MAKKNLQTQTNAENSALDRRWHLAQSGSEVDTTEFEFALMRAFEGFGRWQSECLASVCDLAATGPENAMLHIIRMNDRPKSLKEIARLMNRDDVPNIQYSLRKLLGAGLIVRQGAGRSGVTYACSEAGLRVTEEYAVLRRKLLLAEIANVPGFAERLAEASRTLNLLSGIYEEVARVAATHRRG
jgi:predicted MarR family transcription regulator